MADFQVNGVAVIVLGLTWTLLSCTPVPRWDSVAKPENHSAYNLDDMGSGKYITADEWSAYYGTVGADIRFAQTPEGTVKLFHYLGLSEGEEVDEPQCRLMMIRSLIGEDCDERICRAAHFGDLERLTRYDPPPRYLLNDRYDFGLSGKHAALLTVAWRDDPWPYLTRFGLVKHGQHYRIHTIMSLIESSYLGWTVDNERLLDSAIADLKNSLKTRDGQSFLASNPANPLEDLHSKFAVFLGGADNMTFQSRLFITEVLRNIDYYWVSWAGQPYSGSADFYEKTSFEGTLLKMLDENLKRVGVMTVREQFP